MKRARVRRINWPFAAIVLLALGLFTSKSIGATITLNPVADADIRQFDPTGSHGDEPSVTSGQLGQNANFEIRRVLMRFDVSQIPAGAVINSATLRVTVVRNPASPVNSIFEIRRVLQLWTEAGVSWNFRTSAQTPWQTAGATGSADSVGFASSSILVGSTDFAQYTFSSTTALVADIQAWANDPSVNFGWLLISEDEVSHFTARRFGSREDPTHAPVLTINYSMVSLAVSIQPPSQNALVGRSVTFTANVTGTPPFAYQWFFNSNPLTDQTNNSLVLNNVQTNDSGNYTVTVSNQSGTATSPPAVLTVSTAPAPPTVTIISPSPIGSDLRFPIGSNITVTAKVVNNGANITQVDFFAAVNGLESTNIGSVGGSLTNQNYTINWLPAGPADFTLTATALDELGQTGQSTGVLVRIFVPELILPTVAITDGPKNFARVTESPITLSGTASDNIGLDRVEFSVVSGPLLQNISTFTNAEGTENWIAQVPLQAGKNAVRVRSVDLANNKSAIVTRFYTYSTQAPLTVTNIGDGFVIPDLDGRNLELGKIYTVTAHAGPNQIFSQWEIRTNSDRTLTNNVLFTNRATLSFLMRSNLVLVADFETNQFPAVAGTYSGPFFDADTNRFRPENAGLFTLQLGNKGGFSGRTVIQGVGYPFRGKFDLLGKAQVGIVRRAQPPVSLLLQLDMSGSSNAITGTVTTSSDANTLTSMLLAHRRADSAPVSGQQIFSLVDDASNQIVTASASINSSGNVGIQGVLKPLRVFSFATSMGIDASVPFYLTANRGSEVIIGWLQFGSGQPEGQLYWVSPSFTGVSLLTAVGQ